MDSQFNPQKQQAGLKVIPGDVDEDVQPYNS
jgi:hypothetical protein